ncbi:MAG: hypothetical protein O7E57_14195 [Gammaproteobacteria bacterium]|nr:hypothetical protein [Gammaproteobacteria bacterium]
MGEFDARSHFDRGIELFGEYYESVDDVVLASATEEFRLAAAAEPGEINYWIALGYSLDSADDRPGALEVLRRAAQLDSTNSEVEVLILTLLAETGAESEAMDGARVAAARQGIDIAAIQKELEVDGLPVNAINVIRQGFIRARNFLWSWIQDEIDAAERRKEPDKLTESEQLDFNYALNEIRRELDSEQVPVVFQSLVPWAVRLGIGDDVFRGMVVASLTNAEQREVISAVDKHATLVDAWLDTPGDQPMTPTQAAFMYLLLAIEEMR